MTLRFAAALLGFAASLAPVEAQAGRVKIVNTTASSTYVSDTGAYEAKKVADGKISTAWVEGDEGSGLGAWVELDLESLEDLEKAEIPRIRRNTKNHWMIHPV